jgi:hypothetical protein
MAQIKPPDRHLEGGIEFERIAVVSVGIAGRDQQRVAPAMPKGPPHRTFAGARTGWQFVAGFCWSSDPNSRTFILWKG